MRWECDLFAISENYVRIREGVVSETAGEIRKRRMVPLCYSIYTQLLGAMGL